MLTPSDIEKKVFSKSMRGYNADEVDEFLDQIIMDWKLLMSENKSLHSQIETLKEEIGHFRKREVSVLGTIESAKRLMSDISDSAEKQAEVILKNAHLDAEVIQKDAKESVSRLTRESEQMLQRMNRFKERYRRLLQDELKSLENSTSDILDEFERDFLPEDGRKAQEEAYGEAEGDQAVKNRKTIRAPEQTVEEMLMKDFNDKGPSGASGDPSGTKTIVA